MGLYLTSFYRNMSGAVWPVIIGYVTTCVPVGLPLTLYMRILTPSLKKKCWVWWDVVLFFKLTAAGKHFSDIRKFLSFIHSIGMCRM